MLDAIFRFLKPMWPSGYCAEVEIEGKSYPVASTSILILANQARHAREDASFWKSEFDRISSAMVWAQDSPGPQHASAVERALGEAAREVIASGALKNVPATFIKRAVPYVTGSLAGSGAWVMRKGPEGEGE